MAACSIVVNNHNYGRYLRRCVDSCLSQTIPVEVVVVDDGSTDDSLEILRGYGNDIKLVAQPNGGQASAVNSGVAEATSPIILMLDSDDWIFPRRAERVVEMLADDGGWLRHNLQVYDEITGPGRDLYTERRLSPPEQDVDRYGQTQGTMSGLAFTTNLLSRIGPIPTGPFRIHADYYLKVSAAYLATCTTITDVLCVRHLHAGQITSRRGGSKERVATRIQLRRAIAERAASLSSDTRVKTGNAWWQRKTALHSACLGGNFADRLTEVPQYASSLWHADMSLSRKAGFLARETMLAMAPRGLFPRLWWVTSDGRPPILKSAR